MAVAAAAVAAAVIAGLVVPMVVRPPQPIQAIPAVTPTATPSGGRSVGSVPVGSWVPTAKPPISPRNSAVAAWVDGQFLVVGGDGWVPCPADAAACDRKSPTLRDGARYDPATNTWTRIADAPKAVWQWGGLANPIGDSWAVLGRTLYAYGRDSQGDADALLAYDLDTDKWTQFPGPAENSAGMLASDGQTLVSICTVCNDAGADANGHAVVYWQVFDQDRGVWSAPFVRKPPSPLPAPVGATLVDGKIVAVLEGSRSKETPSPMRIFFFDARTGDRDSGGILPIPIQRPNPRVLGKFAVWPSGGDADAGVDAQRASFYSVARSVLSDVQLPDKNGPFTVTEYDASGLPALAAIVTTDTMIALRGFLYDPSVGKWSPTPALPGPSGSPVLAGGGDYILDCFGYASAVNKYAPGCYVLRPAPATSDKPTATG